MLIPTKPDRPRNDVVLAARTAALLAACLFGPGAPAPAEEGGVLEADAARAPVPYDPIRKAAASVGKSRNLEAAVPPQCYTKTGGESNPCWTCHTVPRDPNYLTDWDLQEEYSFSEFALRNRWTNLFADRAAAISGISDAEALEHIRGDNYTHLITALKAAKSYPGYVPDLDFARGFDSAGFAADGSGWRAFRYKPFPGTFWPTNGSTDDVMVRLAPKFRRDEGGTDSRDVYRINLAILEAAIAAHPNRGPKDLEMKTEPLDEVAAGFDLDGDGKIGRADRIRGLPQRYAGGARDVRVSRYLFPAGTEFLHTVRYVDPESLTLMSRRMKEVRYSRKVEWLDHWAIVRAHEKEHADKDEGVLPQYRGSPLVGLRNEFGWQLQGFIEDAGGRLRLQTEEEHRFCMGCHGALGVTVDHTFAMARKVPGPAGWGHQDLRGIKDVPQAGHPEPETLTYLKRVRGGDEFRANDEMIRRFFKEGVLDEAEARRAAPGGDKDILFLIAPSRERALLLAKAYMSLVREQVFEKGRDAVISPARNVHVSIKNGSTRLGETRKVHVDGRLWLEWGE